MPIHEVCVHVYLVMSPCWKRMKETLLFFSKPSLVFNKYSGVGLQFHFHFVGVRLFFSYEASISLYENYINILLINLCVI
jgi:hypothetical protein